MTGYRIEMPRMVRDLIRHLPPELKAKIKAALRSISDDPYRAKELRDDLAGLRSYRVARSRVIYRIRGSTVQIVALGPRADIYERAAVELSKMLRKGKAR
jgi:mRNA-degrading endonuclease RelE of RelBE toxin-antitoxin system